MNQICDQVFLLLLAYWLFTFLSEILHGFGFVFFFSGFFCGTCVFTSVCLECSEIKFFFLKLPPPYPTPDCWTYTEPGAGAEMGGVGHHLGVRAQWGGVEGPSPSVGFQLIRLEGLRCPSWFSKMGGTVYCIPSGTQQPGSSIRTNEGQFSVQILGDVIRV